MELTDRLLGFGWQLKEFLGLLIRALGQRKGNVVVEDVAKPVFAERLLHCLRCWALAE